VRVIDRLDRLYAIGGGIGANRPGYTAAEDEAHEVDPGAGNVIPSRVRLSVDARAPDRELPVHELHSGAGHDAAILAGAGVPTAMLFVRSRNGGISHSPDERSGVDDIALAVDVLAGALQRLASRRH
jgi:acetylornithine deacetylase/succinyl-diaminopimelate desuccinylase-like protein